MPRRSRCGQARAPARSQLQIGHSWLSVGKAAQWNREFELPVCESLPSGYLNPKVTLYLTLSVSCFCLLSLSSLFYPSLSLISLLSSHLPFLALLSLASHPQRLKFREPLNTTKSTHLQAAEADDSCKYIDSRRPLFKVFVRLDSTVLPSDLYISSFLSAAVSTAAVRALLSTQRRHGLMRRVMAARRRACW